VVGRRVGAPNGGSEMIRYSHVVMSAVWPLDAPPWRVPDRS
jgi:hypothetical protein